MKKIISYEGDAHEDSEMFSIIDSAMNMHLALWEFSNWLRAEYKHSDREAVPVEELREKFYEILSSNDVKL